MTAQTAPRYVAYYRVSTVQQGRSGLGLEAQQDAVARFVAQNGGAVLASYPVLLFFAAMTGFTPSVTRAVFMQMWLSIAETLLQHMPTAAGDFRLRRNF